jgi:hypothetical protein
MIRIQHLNILAAVAMALQTVKAQQLAKINIRAIF